LTNKASSKGDNLSQAAQSIKPWQVSFINAWLNDLVFPFIQTGTHISIQFNKEPFMLKKMIHLSLFVVLLVSALMFAKPAAAAPAMSGGSCTINLVANTNTCSGQSSWLMVQQGNGQALTEVSGMKTITYAITYGSVPSGWTVNIGDSATNDGYGGDSGTQSNDAELQVVNANMAIFGNDYNTPAGGLLKTVAGIANTSYPLNLTVKNQYLSWQMYVVNGSLSSPYLYALAGQPDLEGPINSDIYAAFNRTIGDTSRSGTGVVSVTITASN